MKYYCQSENFVILLYKNNFTGADMKTIKPDNPNIDYMGRIDFSDSKKP